MARISVPAYESLQDSSTAPSEALDALFGDAAASKDTYEVIDTPAPVMTTTTSTNPSKPRTLKAGYDEKTQTLTVVFRDGTWWDYRGVAKNIWETFKAAESKGRFLRESGLDSWSDMGPSDVSGMAPSRRAQLNDIKAFADKMYGGLSKVESTYSIELPSRRKK